MKTLLFNFLLLMILNVSILTSDDVGNDSFGSCPPEKDSCSECYLALKKSLLGRDDNIRNLSLGFFPTQDDYPEFVTVTYNFGNISSQTWFWTQESSYLFLPLKTFQYLSLAFGKFERDVSQQVTLTLDAECSSTDPKTMELLTQRLKDFIERKKFNPEIDQNYFAKSHRSTAMEDDDILTKNIANIFVILYVLGNTLVLVIIVILLIIYLYRKRWDRMLNNLSGTNKSNVQTQSKLFGIAGIGLIFNMYALSLDACAVSTWDIENELENKLAPILIIALIFTFASLCWCCVLLLLSCTSWFECCFNSNGFMFLALSILGPTFALVTHVPFITIAFLNDPYHASGTFIFYTIVFFILFGALQLSHSTCQGARYNQLEVDNIYIPDAVMHFKYTDNGEQRTVHNVGASTLLISTSDFKFSHLDLYEMSIKIREATIEIAPERYDCLQQLHQLYQQNAVPMEVNLGDLLSTARCDLVSGRDRTCQLTNVTGHTINELNAPNDNFRQGTLRNVNTQSGKITISFDDLSFIITRGILLWQPHPCFPPCARNRDRIWTSFLLIPLFIVIILALIVLITYTLVQAPINQAFSDAPNRLLGFYQTALILIGAYFLYKKLYVDKKKPSIQNAVKERMTHIPSEHAHDTAAWNHLSKEEKVKAFYSRVVDVVATYEHNA